MTMIFGPGSAWGCSSVIDDLVRDTYCLLSPITLRLSINFFNLLCFEFFFLLEIPTNTIIELIVVPGAYFIIHSIFRGPQVLL